MSVCCRIIIALVRVGCSFHVPFGGDKSLNLQANQARRHHIATTLASTTAPPALQLTQKLFGEAFMS